MMVNGHRKIVKDRTAHGLKVWWKDPRIQVAIIPEPNFLEEESLPA